MTAVPEAALNTGFDLIAQALRNVGSDERKTAVRWFNRLYYDVLKWNEEFIKFLRSYPGFSETPNVKDVKDFYDNLRQYRDGLDARYGMVKGNLCTNLRILDARFPIDFRWLHNKEPGTYDRLRSILTSAYESEEEICNLADGVTSFIWNIYPHQDGEKPGLDIRIKECIQDYENKSRSEVAKLQGHATSVGIHLLNVAEYERAIAQQGSSNPEILILGEITNMIDASNTTTTTIGTISGSNVNIASTLTNVSQSIGALPKADHATKDELQKLVAELFEQLKGVPAEKKELAEAVSAQTADVIDKAKQEKPNKTILQIAASGLKTAAETLKDVAPSVVSLATSIVAIIGKMHGIG